MGNITFTAWFWIGSYGGLACGMLAAAAIAGHALVRHRGTPRQLARAVLVCLVAGCFSLGPIWWAQNRLDLYGPSLSDGEIVLWLGWVAVAGWFLPLSMLAGYVLLAGPQPLTALAAIGQRRVPSATLASLDDPARHVESLASGRAWGTLIPLAEDTPGRPIALTRRLTFIGREYDNDIVIDDERTSRHHAEIHWERGHAHLVDRDSMNGTRVNGRSIRGVIPLAEGDILELGAQRYRVEMPRGEAAIVSGTTAEVETRKMPGAGAQVGDAPLSPLTLVALNGPAVGQRWELTAGVSSIGRDAERDITLPHDSISRHHAQIVRQRAGFYLSDLHSSNGTFVNEEPVTEPRLLRTGDVVRFGELALRCDSAPNSVVLSPRSGGAQSLPATDGDVEVAPSVSSSARHDQPTINMAPWKAPTTLNAQEAP